MYELTPYSGGTNGSIFNFFNDLENAFWNEPFRSGNRMMTDIRDKGNYYELSCELPGFERDEIEVDVNDKYLTVTAVKQHSEESGTKSDYLHRERFSGQFKRSFSLTGVELDKIEVSYHNGVLTVILPKSEEKNKTSRKIAIKD